MARLTTPIRGPAGRSQRFCQAAQRPLRRKLRCCAVASRAPRARSRSGELPRAASGSSLMPPLDAARRPPLVACHGAGRATGRGFPPPTPPYAPPVPRGAPPPPSIVPPSPTPRPPLRPIEGASKIRTHRPPARPRGIGCCGSQALARPGAHLTLRRAQPGPTSRSVAVRLPCGARRRRRSRGNLTPTRGRVALWRLCGERIVRSAVDPDQQRVHRNGSARTDRPPLGHRKTHPPHHHAPILLTRDLLPALVEPPRATRKPLVVRRQSGQQRRFATVSRTSSSRRRNALRCGAESSAAPAWRSPIAPVFVPGGRHVLSVSADRVKGAVGSSARRRRPASSNATLRAIKTTTRDRRRLAAPPAPPARLAACPNFSGRHGRFAIGVTQEVPSFLGDAVGEPEGELNGHGRRVE